MNHAGGCLGLLYFNVRRLSRNSSLKIPRVEIINKEEEGILVTRSKVRDLENATLAGVTSEAKGVRSRNECCEGEPSSFQDIPYFISVLYVLSSFLVLAR